MLLVSNVKRGLVLSAYMFGRAVPWPGPISNFVREVGFVHQTTNLSPNRMANWVLASHHSFGGWRMRWTRTGTPPFHASALVQCSGSLAWRMKSWRVLTWP
jgi:hypothetical protein